MSYLKLKKKRPDFKIAKQEWYTRTRSRSTLARLVGQEVFGFGTYEEEVQRYKDNPHNYDGPALYIEPCDDPGFPPRERLAYCVRTSRGKHHDPYRTYTKYYYQENRWFKSKKENMQTSLFTPILTQEEALSIKCNMKHLKSYAIIDIIYYQSKIHAKKERDRWLKTYYSQRLKNIKNKTDTSKDIFKDNE